MKNLIKTMIAAGMILGLQSAYAAPLTIPNTFTANSPAVAADVNTNFAAAKTAVDDNDARIAALDARIAALEVVTDTNINVNPFQKMAGNWAMVSSLFGSRLGGSNFVEVYRDTQSGTAIINADGTFSVSFSHGVNMLIGLTNIGVQFFDLNGIPHTSYDQDVQYPLDPFLPSTATGTITNTGNNSFSAVIPVGPGVFLSFDGFVSQNGQVIIMQGDDGQASDANNIMVMVKIN